MKKPQLTFIGHGSFKVKTKDDVVIYIDPFFNGDYSEKADILIITHNHSDHTKVELVSQNPDCLTIKNTDAIKNGVHQRFAHKGVSITTVEAYNQNHNREECFGVILEFDDIKYYSASDTSITHDMQNKVSKMSIDYATLPVDGIYNMGSAEASKCAKIINTKYAIAVHNDPDVINTQKYSDKNIANFTHVGKIVMKYGETINLDKK